MTATEATKGTPLSKGCTAALILGLIFLLVMPILGFRLHRAYMAFGLALPVLREMNGIDGSTHHETFPMLARYGKGLAALDLPTPSPRLTDEELQKSLEGKEKDVSQLATELGEGSFARDWEEGVEALGLPQPAWLDFSKLGISVDYRETRNLARRLKLLARHLRLEGKRDEALRIHLASHALCRQLISKSKALHGLNLIDAMIALVVLDEGNEGILDLGKATAWRQDFFTRALRRRLEDLDGRLSLVGEAMKLERVFVPSFFENMNRRASERAASPVVIHDAEAARRRADPFYPRQEIFALPYEAMVDELARNERFLMEHHRLEVWDYAKGVLFPMDLVEQMLCSIAVPNMKRAIEREVETRARLRGAYLAMALAAHRVRRGSYPETLEELGSDVQAAMRLDPFTGRLFPYRREGESFRLWSTGKSCSEGETEPTQDAILLVPWERLPEGPKKRKGSS